MFIDKDSDHEITDVVKTACAATGMKISEVKKILNLKGSYYFGICYLQRLRELFLAKGYDIRPYIEERLTLVTITINTAELETLREALDIWSDLTIYPWNREEILNRIKPCKRDQQYRLLRSRFWSLRERLVTPPVLEDYFEEKKK